MGKVSPVSTKYMIHATLMAEGALERPDVIGAIFGQTEGLLGNELEMRELQKEGKIGRIEVDLKRENKRTHGTIKIPTALDRSETALIAAAIETLDRVGPCDTQIDVDKIEDVRESKRDYILKRAKKMMTDFEGSTDSKKFSDEIKDSSRTDEISEYGESKLPAGNLSGKEVIVVEGRADVVNLLKNGVRNVIGMNGTKLPPEIKSLGEEKELTLFVDGDRGGILIAQNVTENAKIENIAVAPEGKEVEELNNKEIWTNLRKKVSVEEFFKNSNKNKKNKSSYKSSYKKPDEKEREKDKKPQEKKEISLTKENKEKLRKISEKIQNSGKAVLLDENIEEIKKVSTGGLKKSLSKISKKPSILVIDGLITSPMIKAAEEAGCQVLVGKRFATSEANLKLLSL